MDCSAAREYLNSMERVAANFARGAVYSILARGLWRCDEAVRIMMGCVWVVGQSRIRLAKPHKEAVT
jgi:hypothetical protein